MVFATTGGTVRRNKLSDFAQVNRAGKIAMKLDEGEAIVDVQICSDADDVLLTTALGQCIRFAVTDVRVFKGRDSMGVRGISLGKGRQRHFAGHPAPHGGRFGRAYRLSQDAARRHGREQRGRRRRRGGLDEAATTHRRSVYIAMMSAAEQIILTVSEKGYGKRTSSFEYRITGRGGKGIGAMAVNARNGSLVASFPVEHGDGIMLVTNGGQLIRCPVDGIRIAGRNTQGVIVFDTAKTEKVVSVERIPEVGDPTAGEGNGETDDTSGDETPDAGGDA